MLLYGARCRAEVRAADEDDEDAKTPPAVESGALAYDARYHSDRHPLEAIQTSSNEAPRRATEMGRRGIRDEGEHTSTAAFGLLCLSLVCNRGGPKTEDRGRRAKEPVGERVSRSGEPASSACNIPLNFVFHLLYPLRFNGLVAVVSDELGRKMAS